MIPKNIIQKSLEDAILKCGPTIKERFETFNSKDFPTEKYQKGQKKTDEPSPIGMMQQRQKDLQKEIDYSVGEQSLAKSYQIGGFWYLNNYLNKVKYTVSYLDEEYRRHEKEYILGETIANINLKDSHHIEEKPYTEYFKDDNNNTIELTMKEYSERLSNVIDKSPRLNENSILYRFGEFPFGLKPGETGKFNSFLSTSYNTNVAKRKIKKMNFLDGNNEAKNRRYQMRIFAPKGTKGMILDESNGCNDFQSEFLIDKGQKYIVLDVDDGKRTVDILLY